MLPNHCEPFRRFLRAMGGPKAMADEEGRKEERDDSATHDCLMSKGQSPNRPLLDGLAKRLEEDEFRGIDQFLSSGCWAVPDSRRRFE
jgi:hypothetical protein